MTRENSRMKLQRLLNSLRRRRQWVSIDGPYFCPVCERKEMNVTTKRITIKQGDRKIKVTKAVVTCTCGVHMVYYERSKLFKKVDFYHRVVDAYRSYPYVATLFQYADKVTKCLNSGDFFIMNKK